MRKESIKIDRLHRLNRPDRLHRLNRLYSFLVYGSIKGLSRVYFNRPRKPFTGAYYSNRVYRVYQVYGFIQNAHFRRIFNGPVYESGLSRVYQGSMRIEGNK